MSKFTTLTSLAAVLDRPNLDTDQIVPKEFLTSIKRSGFARALFYNLRFGESGLSNPEFILNNERFKGAEILVVGENFGCGSSREHAVWALTDFGFKVLIGTGFASIFKTNSEKNSLLLITISEDLKRQLTEIIMDSPGYVLTVDLERQIVWGQNFSCSFDCHPFRKKMLLNGWDDISLTLNLSEKIEIYEKLHPQEWKTSFS
jgi:3-isopropylmalate/(R)-2-methylmalate dehydratase small subunit